MNLKDSQQERYGSDWRAKDSLLSLSNCGWPDIWDDKKFGY